MVAVVALAIAAAILVLYPLRHLSQAMTTTSEPCSPQPCAAPQGFEADLHNISLEAGILRMSATFRNRTTGGFEAVSYRHTSLADFQLRGADGQQSRPVVSALCPAWPELKVERGASRGPVPLCFRAPSGNFHSAQLIWSPDLGLLFDDVQIALR